MKEIETCFKTKQSSCKIYYNNTSMGAIILYKYQILFNLNQYRQIYQCSTIKKIMLISQYPDLFYNKLGFFLKFSFLLFNVFILINT